MPQGVPTPDDVEVKFRKHYLRTGNIRAAARYAELPQSTAQGLADRANADPDFVRARSAMYARAMADAERMLMSGLEVASERLEAASEAQVDPGPQYLRAIVDGAKVIATIRKNTDPGYEGKLDINVYVKDLKDPKDGDEPGSD